jgi:hypothetical protein
MSGWVDMLMATLVSIGGQGAEAPLVSADYRKFAQYELAPHGYLTAAREPQQVPKTGVTALLLATVVFGENVVVGEEGRA